MDGMAMGGTGSAQTSTYCRASLEALKATLKGLAHGSDLFYEVKREYARKEREIACKMMLRERFDCTEEQLELFMKEAKPEERDIAAGITHLARIENSDCIEICRIQPGMTKKHKWEKYTLITIRPPDEEKAEDCINSNLITSTMRKYGILYKKPPVVPTCLPRKAKAQGQQPELNLGKFFDDYIYSVNDFAEKNNI